MGRGRLLLRWRRSTSHVLFETRSLFVVHWFLAGARVVVPLSDALHGRGWTFVPIPLSRIKGGSRWRRAACDPSGR